MQRKIKKGKDIKASEKIFEDANTRLKKAIKYEKNFDEACVVQGLIEVASSKMSDNRHGIGKNRKNQAELDSRRKKLLENVSLPFKSNFVFTQPDTARKNKNRSNLSHA